MKSPARLSSGLEWLDRLHVGEEVAQQILNPMP
jgi:hypothetical protein